MLTNAILGAFVATADPAAAREFYENVLGLEFVSDEPFVKAPLWVDASDG